MISSSTVIISSLAGLLTLVIGGGSTPSDGITNGDIKPVLVDELGIAAVVLFIRRSM